MGAPNHDRVALRHGQLAHHRAQPFEVLLEQHAGLVELHPERGIKHIRTGHAEVYIARFGSHRALEVRKEGDHIVTGFLLDAGYRGHVVGRDFPGPRPQQTGNLGRNQSLCRHCLTGQKLNFHPNLQPVFIGPDVAHLGPGVSGDHDILLSFQFVTLYHTRSDGANERVFFR